MRLFAELYQSLDATTRSSVKLSALTDYFQKAAPADAAWATYYLMGNRPKRLLSSSRLREWARLEAGIPEWLFIESYAHVGDLAETIALLFNNRAASTSGGDSLPLHELMEEYLLPLREAHEEEQRKTLQKLWREFAGAELFILNKLLTGGWRVGVSKALVIRALAQVAGVEPAVMAHRLMGNWQPGEDSFKQLLRADAGALSGPFPFCLASPLTAESSSHLGEQLGEVADWQVEWKWDGIRAQLIKRGGEILLWSRGGEMVNPAFPEIVEVAAGAAVEDFVLDGELLGWDFAGDQPAPFHELQKRLNRKRPTPALCRKHPVVFMAYDLLELNQRDLRDLGTVERRLGLRGVVHALAHSSLRESPVLHLLDWDQGFDCIQQSRSLRVEGLMLKRMGAPYREGRRRGDWWKWKVEPYSVDAVLVYAVAGHGRRAGLFTDYTLALWSNGEMVPFAKAYSGLSDEEILRVDRWIRANTRERHGPVRVVKPELVFEVAFEGVAESARHKSGLAVRFPRIKRWREDKRASDADSLASLRQLLQ